MFQHQPVYSHLEEPARAPMARDETAGEWPVRRKLLAILAGSIAAWLVWAGAGFVIWRALAS